MRDAAEHREFQSLVERARRREPDAVRELCRRYRSLVERVARPGFRQAYGRHVGISDLVQSGLIEVLQKADLILGQSDVPGYVAAMARNQLLESLRKLRAKKRGIDRVEADGDRLDGAYRDDPSASDLAVQTEEVSRALQPLTEVERAALWAHLAEYTYAEIGEFLGTDEDRARRLVQVAMEVIRAGRRGDDA